MCSKLGKIHTVEITCLRDRSLQVNNWVSGFGRPFWTERRQDSRLTGTSRLNGTDSAVSKILCFLYSDFFDCNLCQEFMSLQRLTVSVR